MQRIQKEMSHGAARSACGCSVLWKRRSREMKAALEDGHYPPDRWLLKGKTREKWEVVSIAVLTAALGSNKATGKMLTIGRWAAREPATWEEAGESPQSSKPQPRSDCRSLAEGSVTQRLFRAWLTLCLYLTRRQDAVAIVPVLCNTYITNSWVITNARLSCRPMNLSELRLSCRRMNLWELRWGCDTERFWALSSKVAYFQARRQTARGEASSRNVGRTQARDR